MSIESRQSEVERYLKAIADLQKKDAVDQKKEIAKTKEADRAMDSLNSARTESSTKSHRNRLDRINTELGNIAAKRAKTAKLIADKTVQLHKSQQLLFKEKKKMQKKIVSAEKKREREQNLHQLRTISDLKEQKQISLTSVPPSERSPMKYDVFISHASEDKDSFVRPLAEELTAIGFKVWYDETTLKVGDSLRQKIDQGLASSTYGVVVLSAAFFSKNWPQYELNGLVAKEMDSGKVILPIWHKVSKDEVLSFSPTLADKVALNTSISGAHEIASQLAEVLAEDSS